MYGIVGVDFKDNKSADFIPSTVKSEFERKKKLPAGMAAGSW